MKVTNLNRKRDVDSLSRTQIVFAISELKNGYIRCSSRNGCDVIVANWQWIFGECLADLVTHGAATANSSIIHKRTC